MTKLWVVTIALLVWKLNFDYKSSLSLQAVSETEKK
ncbi:hypothetical protein B0O79_2066 [Flavobacteriaceae bacterium MAR_2009_75]|nr:hypothetical protein B0O79_2066 [Flavobacteriaceae bacterium MAR_2009_75]